MPVSTPDFIVIGSGPNGLVAACTLVKAGFSVLVLESNRERPGGALWSEEATRVGFVHDVGAAFFPFGRLSPAFQHLDLTGHGLVWRFAEIESCHPAADGSVACITREPHSGFEFGSHRDRQVWERLCAWHRSIESELLELLLQPFPALRPLRQLLPANLVRLARILTSSGRGLACRLFESEAARRVLPSLGLHVDVGPDDRFGAGLGYVLGLTATTGGYAVPQGGARAITETLVRILERHGGIVLLGRRAIRVLVRGGRACAVQLSNGDELEVRRGILAGTSAPSLLLDLVESRLLPGRVVRAMRRFEYGWGTFKLDWALSAPVPWSVEQARRSAVVHAAENLDDLSRFTRNVRAGQLPEHPYLVVGQQNVADGTRAPAGSHTLWAYSHIPAYPEGGWERQRDAFADRVESRIEGLAPGFRKLILARRVMAPPDLEAMDANLVRGDIGGGSNAWNHQLVFRPVFPYFRYRMPIRGLYLCSSYAHPGAGVHGMCGFNAARVAARDLA